MCGLERVINEEEVYKAIECCVGDKAPGLCGFSLAFLFSIVGIWSKLMVFLGKG